MGVSKNRGTPKWMVKIMENPIKMDDLEETPLFLETLIYIWINFQLQNLNLALKAHIYINHPSEERIFNHSTVRNNFVCRPPKGSSQLLEAFLQCSSATFHKLLECQSKELGWL